MTLVHLPTGGGACEESRVRALPPGGISSCTERLARSFAMPCGYGRSIVCAPGTDRGVRAGRHGSMATSVAMEESLRGRRECIGFNCLWTSTVASW
jgi:hypothetical protein